jgi:group I intron endonuclease
VIIYCIVNRINGRRYIGMTAMRLMKRWESHVYAMRKGIKTALYDAMRSYGSDAFNIEAVASLLPGLARTDLCAVERELIAQENTLIPNGYNLTAGGDGGLTKKPDAAHVARFVAACQSPEVRAKKSAALRGRKWSAEERERRHANFLEKGYEKRRSCSDEYRAMMSRAKKGTPNKYKGVPISAEHKANIAAGMSQEQKDRFRFARVGKIPWNKGLIGYPKGVKKADTRLVEVE